MSSLRIPRTDCAMKSSTSTGALRNRMLPVLEIGVIVLLVFCPLAFGAVHDISFTIMETIAFLLTALWLLSGLLSHGHSHRRRQAGPPGLGSPSPTSHTPQSVPNTRDNPQSPAVPRSVLLHPVFWLVLFLCFVLFQLCPLPPGVLALLSPKAFQIRAQCLPSRLIYESQQPRSALGHRAPSPEIPNPQFRVPSSEFPVPASALLSPLLAPYPRGALSSWSPLSLCATTTRTEFVKLVSYALMFLLVAYGCRSLGRVRRIAAAGALTGGGLAVLGICQRLTGHGRIYWFWEPQFGGRPFGPYINENHFAGYMVMAIPLAAALWYRKRRSAVFLACLAAMLAALMMTTSAGGMVGAAFATVPLGLSRYLKLRKTGRLALLVLIAVTSIVMVRRGVLAFLDKPRLALDLLHSRPLLWHDALCVWADFAFIGVGFGALFHVLPMYQRLNLTHLTIQFAENEYVQALAEVGAVGAILIAAFWLAWLLPVWRGALRRRSEGAPLAMASLCAASGMAAHSFVDFNLRIPANALMFSVILAIGCASVLERSPSSSRGRLSPDSRI